MVVREELPESFETRTCVVWVDISDLREDFGSWVVVAGFAHERIDGICPE
jgi:hypothetical protein